MTKKSFVSLSFCSQKKLQVLQLDAKKKKVLKATTIEIPVGLIENFRVVDEVALAKILKGTWKKIGLKEKSVAIVVPELSTFTKILSLPKLEFSELDEAVRWQIVDFLPRKAKEIVVDWKIIEETDAGTQALVVSIAKDILQGYVRSAGLAGLFPLAVETPSLSIARIAGSQDKGRLIFYENFGLVHLMIAQGEKIIGSSVVDASEAEEVVRVSQRMLRHYTEVSVDEIVIGGPQINKNLINNLTTTLKKPAGWVKPMVAGFTPIAFQDYLVPLSLQFMDPAEPMSATTVNLLPSEIVERYAKKKLKLQIWSTSLMVSLIVWFSFLITLGVYLFMGQSIALIKKNNTLNKIPLEKAKTIEQVKGINDISEKTLKIVKESVEVQTIINPIAKAKPGEVTLTRFRVDFETGAIEIVGISQTRTALIEFKEALEEVKDFSLVSVPISSLEEESDLEYVMRFNYLPISSRQKGGAKK